MHRSGTSALTRVFGFLGADLPKNLMAAHASNPTGHWESNDLMAIHDRLLASAGSNWHDWRKFNPDWFASPAARPFEPEILSMLRQDFAASRLFAIKDPRICRFWPLWRNVLTVFRAEPAVVMPVRNPAEVAASLKQRDGLLPATSYLIWLRHVLDAESATRGLPRAIVSYEALIDDWPSVVAAMAPQLRLHWPRRSAMVDIEIEQYLSADFKHHNVTPERLAGKPEVVDWVREAYAALTDMAEHPEDRTAMARLDLIGGAFDKASAAFGITVAMNEIEITKRDTELQRVTADLSTLREATAQREREQQDAAAALSAELAAARVSAAERDAHLAEQGKKAAALGEQLAAASEKSEQLSRARDAIKAALEVQKAAAAKLRAELDAVQAAVTERTRERDQFAAVLEAEKTTAARANEQMAAAQVELRAREGELGRLGRELEAARLYLRDSQAEVQRLAGELDGAGREVARAAAERQGLSEALAAASAERDRLAAALEEEKGALGQANEQAAALGREAEALRDVVREYEATATEFLSDLEAMQALAAERERQRDQFAAELETVRQEAESQSERLTAMQALTQERARERNQFAAELETARREAESQSKRLAAMEVLAQERERERNQFAAELETARREAESQSKRLAAMEVLAQERERERNEFAAELETARQEAEWQSERLAVLSRELQSAAAEAERVRPLEATLTALQQDHDRREQLVIELSKQLETERSENCRLTGEHHQALDTADAQANRVRELETRLEVQSGERDRLAANLARAGEEAWRIESNAAERTAAREAAHAAALAESERKARGEIRVIHEKLVDAEAELANGRRKRSIPLRKRLTSLLETHRLRRLLIQSGLFDTQWYMREYPEAAQNGRVAIDHYLEEGYLHGFRPNPLFDSRWYLQHYEDVRRAGLNPLVHYLQFGYREGRNPGPGFETEYYLEANPDVRGSRMNPLGHYLLFGRHEGRPPLRPE